MGPFLCLTMLCGLLGQAPVVSADRPPPDRAQTLADGLLSLHRPALAAKLQLSPDQNRAANKEIVRYQTELRVLYGNYPPGAQDAEGEQIRQRLRQQHTELRKATIQHLTELLTDPQREQLVGLSPLYADEETPEQPAQDDRPACTIVKTGDAQLRQEIRFTENKAAVLDITQLLTVTPGRFDPVKEKSLIDLFFFGGQNTHSDL